LKIGTTEQNLNLISTIEANVKSDIKKYVENIEGKPDSVLVGLLYVNDRKKLGQSESWIKAVCERIMNDPRARSYVLTELVNFLKGSATSYGPPEIQIWTKLLELKDSSPDDLIFAANALKELRNPNLELEAWQKVMLYPYLFGKELADAARAFERLGKSDLALTAWTRAIEQDDAATINPHYLILATVNTAEDNPDLALKALKWAIGHEDAATINPQFLILAAATLEDSLGNPDDLALKALKLVIAHHDATPLSLNNLIWAAYALERLGAETDRTLEVWTQVIKHTETNPNNLIDAAYALERLGAGTDRTLELVKQAIAHKDATTIRSDYLIFAAETLEKLGEPDLTKQTEERIKELQSVQE